MPKRRIDLDPVIPSKILGLQIIAYASVGALALVQAHPVLLGMVVDDDRTYWFDINVVSAWANGGKSTSHYVFVKEN